MKCSNTAILSCGLFVSSVESLMAVWRTSRLFSDGCMLVSVRKYCPKGEKSYWTCGLLGVHTTTTSPKSDIFMGFLVIQRLSDEPIPAELSKVSCNWNLHSILSVCLSISIYMHTERRRVVETFLFQHTLHNWPAGWPSLTVRDFQILFQMTQQDLNFVAQFLKENFTEVCYHGGALLSLQLVSMETRDLTCSPLEPFHPWAQIITLMFSLPFRTPRMGTLVLALSWRKWVRQVNKLLPEHASGLVESVYDMEQKKE